MSFGVRPGDVETLRAGGWTEAGEVEGNLTWSHPAYPGHQLSTWLAVCFERARTASPSTRELAQRAVEAQERREAELAAMSPEERDKAIEEWARKLAEDVADADD